MALTLGLTQGPRLLGFTSQFPNNAIVGGVMFLMAIPMRFGQLTSAVRRFDATGLALLLNMAAAPLLAWGVSGMLLEPFAIGLVIAASVPCTLASAAVWTRRGGGNDAIALVVTLVTNLACFAVLPFWIWLLLGRIVNVTGGGGGSLALQLFLLVVLPIIAAQLLRTIPAVAEAADRRKLELSIAAQIGLLVMVFVGAVSAGNTLATLQASTSSIGLSDGIGMILAVLAIHLLLFAGGWWGGALLGQPQADRLAVAIAGSQKTLMVGLYIALTIDGLVVLPMVAYHVIQLFADTVLVDRLRPHVLQSELAAG